MSIMDMEIDENSNGALNVDMKRTAIDFSGRLGSLYDGCRDQLVGQLSVDNQENLYQSHKILQSGIIRGNDDQIQNLLRLLSVNEQLRLSILLRLTPSGGITSLIDYPHITNEYTRLLSYFYVDGVQQLSDRIEDVQQRMNSSIFTNVGTHIITGIEWGIYFVVVLQLPSDTNLVTQIDHVLDKVLTILLNDDCACTLTPDEESLLERIGHTKVYSNTPDLNNLTTVCDICRYIKEKPNNVNYYPITYILRPIKWLYTQYNGVGGTFTPLPIDLNDNIEDYLLQLTLDVKKLEMSVTENMSKLSFEHLTDQHFNVRHQWLDVMDKYRNEIQRLSSLVIEIRSGQVEKLMMIPQVLSHIEQMTMKNSINGLIQNLKDLEKNYPYSSDLDRQQVQHLDIAVHDIDETDTGMIIEHKLVADNQHDPLLYPSDYLNERSSEQLQKLPPDSVENPNEDFSLHLAANDSPSSPLSTIVQTSIPPCAEVQVSVLSPRDTNIPVVPPLSASMSTDKTINILLLGETGVGKSTFINAFANYLAFNTLQEAEVSKPVVLIPVSFLITVGDNFEEHMVKFGDVDGLTNEDFDHPGQSVTQRCQTHRFSMDKLGGKKLCIIDTPGFADTRGVEQDDRNIQHILEYTKTLSHIDAICFLLKPNESRLNICYRLCLMQLLSCLDSNIGKNIIFCFTNARSTFYTPGDTAPLLKKMLASLPMADVPFKKDNTFCFDSESFRYLVALQNGISFKDLDRQEYEMSWTNSVMQANRFIANLLRKFTIQ
jgi:hypothetical protein